MPLAPALTRSIIKQIASTTTKCAVLTMTLMSAFAATPQTTENHTDVVQRFEVASLRISGARIHMYSRSEPGAHQAIINNANLWLLSSLAFGDVGVSGMPKWAIGTAYNIRATAPNDRGLSYEEMRVPLQHLLEDRLHLQWHRETARVSGYALVVTKGGARLTPSDGAKYENSAGWSKEKGQIFCSNVSSADLALMLSRVLDLQPMVDQTGLTGRYDLRTFYAPEGATDSTERPLIDILHAYGLDIVKRKVDHDTIVIDHVDEVPVDN